MAELGEIPEDPKYTNVSEKKSKDNFKEESSKKIETKEKTEKTTIKKNSKKNSKKKEIKKSETSEEQKKVKKPKKISTKKIETKKSDKKEESSDVKDEVEKQKTKIKKESKEIKETNHKTLNEEKKPSKSIFSIKNLIIVGILLILLIAFYVRSNGNALASVGTYTITQKELNRQLNLYPPQIASIIDSNEVLKQLITEKLFLLEAKNLDITVSSDEITKNIDLVKKNLGANYSQQITKLGFTDSSLEQFYKEQLTIAKFINQSLKVNINEEEIKQFYIDNLKLFKQGEQVHAYHLLYENETEAQKTLKELNNKTFKELSNTSKDPTYDLGYFERGRMVSEFENFVFNTLKPNETGIVKTQFGYHVVKVLDKKPATTLTYEEVKDQINQTLSQQKQQKKLKELQSELFIKYSPKLNSITCDEYFGYKKGTALFYTAEWCKPCKEYLTNLMNQVEIITSGSEEENVIKACYPNAGSKIPQILCNGKTLVGVKDLTTAQNFIKECQPKPSEEKISKENLTKFLQSKQ